MFPIAKLIDKHFNTAFKTLKSNITAIIDIITKSYQRPIHK